MKKVARRIFCCCLSVCAINAISAVSTSAIAIKNVKETKIEAYIESFDFEECYNSDTLGQDVKNRLMKIQKYVSKNSDYTIEELNEVVGTINESSSMSKAVEVSKASYDYSKHLPTSLTQLNSKEKVVYNSNPTWGLVVLVQADFANTQEKAHFGSNSWGTNGDAFRHALWNAMGARGTSGSYMASFATAHETGSSNYNPNSVDTKMDLQNNAKGRSLLKSMSFPSRPANGMVIPHIITVNIATAAKDGKLVRFVANNKQHNYLMATNSSSRN